MNPLLSDAQGILRGDLPRLDYHMHTTWTDGAHSSREMYDAAVAANLSCILFSEHARQTSEDWFHDFAAEIRALPASPCRALVGVEAKVLDFAGNIDSTPGIVGACDLVMASVHRFPKTSENGVQEFADTDPATAVETERRLSLAVLDNPEVDILGHAFGVSMTRFAAKPTEADYRAVIEKAATTGVAFEINSHYHANPWRLVEWCREAGAVVSLGSNAHHIDDVGQIVEQLETSSPT